jgi:hypothetical protein
MIPYLANQLFIRTESTAYSPPLLVTYPTPFSDLIVYILQSFTASWAIAKLGEMYEL